MTGLVIIYVWILPICPAQVDAINEYRPNSPGLLPTFQSLLIILSSRPHLLVVVPVVVVVLLPEEPVRLLVRVQLVLAGGVLWRRDALFRDDL